MASTPAPRRLAASLVYWRASGRRPGSERPRQPMSPGEKPPFPQALHKTSGQVLAARKRGLSGTKPDRGHRQLKSKNVQTEGVIHAFLNLFLLGNRLSAWLDRLCFHPLADASRASLRNPDQGPMGRAKPLSPRPSQRHHVRRFVHRYRRHLHRPPGRPNHSLQLRPGQPLNNAARRTKPSQKPQGEIATREGPPTPLFHWRAGRCDASCYPQTLPNPPRRSSRR